MDFNFNFDATTVTPDAGLNFEPIPKGEYTLIANDVELKQTQSGGKGINVKFRVMGGDFDNRVIFHNFNVENANPTAQQIGLSQLSAFCHAVNKLQLNAQNLMELQGIPFKAMVDIRAQKDRGPQNVITKFGESKGKTVVNAPGAPKAPTAPSKPQAPSAPLQPTAPAQEEPAPQTAQPTTPAPQVINQPMTTATQNSNIPASTQPWDTVAQAEQAVQTPAPAQEAPAVENESPLPWVTQNS